jgi:hypothetical protein
MGVTSIINEIIALGIRHGGGCMLDLDLSNMYRVPDEIYMFFLIEQHLHCSSSVLFMNKG